MAVLLNLAIIFLVLLLILYFYIQWKFTYWKRRGLPYHKPNFPLGIYNIRNPNAMHFSEILKEQYAFFKALGHKHFGINLGTRPIYIPIDPELLKNIMIKDFKYFSNRGIYRNEKDDPLNTHLLSLEGQKWKDMREKISSIFSSSKTKMMFETIFNCSSRIISMINKLSDIEEAVDMKEVTSCYSTDVMASCIFGIDNNSYEDDQNEFRKHAKAFFMPLTTFDSIKWIIAVCNADLACFLKISVTPEYITKYFLRIVKDTVYFREKANFYKPDLMQLLIDLKNNQHGDNCATNNKPNLTMLELTAQCYMFFNAGIQSTSTSITFCLHELAKNLDIQKKLRNEINEVINEENGEFTYHNIMKMKYLHQVVEETLRMYPSLYITTRQCTEDYHVPNSNVTIEKGTLVFLPISALHRDADFFPEPDKFDPERFNQTNKPKIRPFTYLPFGEGPKYCIASRLGEMQVKVGIAVLLKHFRFTLNKKSSTLRFDPYVPMLAVDGPAWFTVQKI